MKNEIIDLINDENRFHEDHSHLKIKTLSDGVHFINYLLANENNTEDMVKNYLEMKTFLSSLSDVEFQSFFQNDYNLNTLDNQIKEVVNLSKDENISDTFKNALSRLKTLSADILENMSLKIRGREQSDADIKDIMNNCSLQTKYGGFINPFNLKDEDFKPELFAHSLSRELRFWKQTDLSVAEHSVNLSKLFPDNSDLQKWALFHEIFEAYTHDLATPFKKCLPEYKIAENKALAQFAKNQGLIEEMPKEIHIADKRMMITEALKYMPDKEYWLNLGHEIGMKEFGFPLEPYDLEILKDIPLDKKEAELSFAKTWIDIGLPTSKMLNELLEKEECVVRGETPNELRRYLSQDISLEYK